MYSLPACKWITVAMFYFAVWKTLQILWKMFLIPSLYVFGKNLLVSKYKKQMCYKKNKSLLLLLSLLLFCFFDVMKYDHIISSKLWHFLYNNRFLFSREMENIRSCKEIKLQKLMKLRLSEHYLFWHFSSCLKMNNHLGRASSSYFLQNVLMET